VSYGLLFKPRRRPADAGSILGYFRDRGDYKVEGRQAVYSNPDTGVSFTFETDEATEAGATFTLDDLRPSTFIREAEPEVAAFVRHFDWIVHDPQIGGLPEDAHDGDRLVAAWNRRHDAALRDLLQDPTRRAGLLTLPQAVLDQAWRWNRNRRTLQREVGEAKFVPRIMFTLLDGAVSTASVWSDAIPMVFSSVDYIIVYRKAFAPRKLFKRPVPDWALIAWKDALDALQSQVSERSPGTFEITYKSPPATVRAYMSGLKSLAQCPPLVAADKVLDRETMERALAAL
jgi:hypothetical protein